MYTDTARAVAKLRECAYLEGIWGAIVYMYHDIDAYKINTFSSEDMHGDMCHGIDIMFDILHK